MSESLVIKEGWAIPQLAKKAHYFRDGISLCRGWMFMGDIYKDEQVAKQLPGDCKACWKLLEREKKK